MMIFPAPIMIEGGSEFLKKVAIEVEVTISNSWAEKSSFNECRIRSPKPSFATAQTLIYRRARLTGPTPPAVRGGGGAGIVAGLRF
jgi:hypothetical protein